MLNRRSQWRFADGLRGVACLIVVLLHGLTPVVPTMSSYFRGVPKTGVWLFFVLSAFLLTRKLIIPLDASYGRQIGSYLVSRFLRIYPMYALTLMAYFMFGSSGVASWEVVVKSLLLDIGVLHFWTVPPEFKFYLLLPFMIPPLLWLKRRGEGWLLVGSAVTVVMHQLFFPYFEAEYNSLSVVDYFPVFLFGAVTALLIDDVKVDTHRGMYDLIVLGLLIAFVLAVPGVRNLLFDQPMSRDLVDKFVLYGFGWALLIWLVCHGAVTTRRVLELHPLVVVGKASFPIYLCHWLLQRELGIGLANPITQFFVTLTASIGAGFLLHVIVEKPINRYRHAMETIILGLRPKADS